MHVPTKGRVVVIAVAATLFAGNAETLSAQAQGGDIPAIVVYRKALMNTNVQRLRALRALTSGEIEDREQVRKLASVLAENGRAMMSQAFAGIHDMFPEGSMHATSRAIAPIWEKSAEFTERVRAFAVAAQDLEQAAQRGSREQIVEAIAAVGQTCGGCHTEFRGPAPAGS